MTTSGHPIGGGEDEHGFDLDGRPRYLPPRQGEEDDGTGVNEADLASNGEDQNELGGLIEQIEEPRLRTLSRGILDLIQIITEIDQLTPASQITVGQLKGEQQRTLDLLGRLSDTSSEVESLGNLAYTLLIRNLRYMNIPWSRIAEETKLQAAGLHRRYASAVAEELKDLREK